MKSGNLPLRVVFYYEQDRWVAHCLEFDLVGDGESKEEALQSLTSAIHAQVMASVEMDNAENLFSPAPGKYLQMFAKGKHVMMGAVHLSFDGVEIEEVEAREYSDSAC